MSPTSPLLITRFMQLPGHPVEVWQGGHLKAQTGLYNKARTWRQKLRRATVRPEGRS